MSTRHTIKDLTQKRLKKLLHYDPLTGVWTWIQSTSNRISINERAGTVNPNGYRYIRINKKDYLSSRLAFLYKKGYFPEQEADHENRIRSDDKWKNIREASPQCNMRNRRIPKNNTSGIIGVHWDSRLEKWRAQIKVSYKCIYLGQFETKAEAAKSRWIAEKKYGYPNCSTTSSSYLYLKERNLL